MNAMYIVSLFLFTSQTLLDHYTQLLSSRSHARSARRELTAASWSSRSCFLLLLLRLHHRRTASTGSSPEQGLEPGSLRCIHMLHRILEVLEVPDLELDLVDPAEPEQHQVRRSRYSEESTT